MQRACAFALSVASVVAQTWVVYTPVVYSATDGTCVTNTTVGRGSSDPNGATCAPVSNLGSANSVGFSSCADGSVGYTLYSDNGCTTAISAAVVNTGQFVCTNVTVGGSQLSMFVSCDAAPGPSTHGVIIGFSVTLALMTAFLLGMWVYRDYSHKKRSVVEEFEAAPQTGSYQSLNGGGH